MKKPLSYAQHLRAVLVLGLPLIGSQVAQFSITIIDTLMLGWYDLTALAGQVLGGSLFFVIFLAGSGFAMAVMPMVARAEAMGDLRLARRVTRMSMWISVAYGLLMLPLLIWSGPLLQMLGQEADVAQTAQDYTRLVGISVVPALLVMVLKSYLAALERTKVVLWVTLAAVVVNVIVNYVLIFGSWGAPEMGVRGAAMASVAVHTVTFVWLAIYVVRVTPEHAIFARLWRGDREALSSVFRLGWPIGLTNLAEVALFSGASLMMGWLGKVPLAAHGIALQLAGLTFMVHIGLSSAATVRAGQAQGRGDVVALRRGAYAAITLSMGFALLTMAIFLIFRGSLIGLFVDPSDPMRDQVIAVGAVLLAAAALFQMADGGQVMALGLLRGVQDTQVPMWMAAVSYWVVGAPVSYVLGFVVGWGGVGIWIGLSVGLGVAAVLLLMRFWLISVHRVTAGG